MSTARQQLVELIEQGAIAQEHTDAALDVLKVRPDASAWRGFVDRLLLWTGALALAFSVLFFIAHNWAELGRFAKFGMLQLAVALATLAFWRIGPERATGQASLLVAAILLGVLLAYFGQTYQTGADPWELFFYWALLMLPWAIIGRFAGIWILWLLLLNLTVILYHQAFSGFLSLAMTSEMVMLWELFLLNTVALCAWELAANVCQGLNRRWAIRLLALAGGLPVTWVTLRAIGGSGDFGFGTGMIWFLWLAAMYLVYHRLRRDLFMLAGCCLSGIVVSAVFTGKQLLMGGNDAALSLTFLVLALLVIGMGAASAAWLKTIHRQWHRVERPMGQERS